MKTAALFSLLSAVAMAAPHPNMAASDNAILARDATPASIGCYQDTGSRVLNTKWTATSNMTPQKCIDFCTAAGTAYAGTQYGNQCYCGQTQPPTKLADSSCQVKCTGSTDKCGGSWALTVYKIGSTDASFATADPNKVYAVGPSNAASVFGGGPIPDRFNISSPGTVDNGFASGTYADGLPKYWRYYFDYVNGKLHRWYERSPIPPEGNVIVSAKSTAQDVAGTSDASKEFLRGHNQFRAQFGQPALKWNATMAARAVEWSNQCKFEHWGDDNLISWWGTNSWLAAGFPALWADEWWWYNFNDPKTEAYSHFTQMTWKSATDVGCAWNLCPRSGGGNEIMISCRYTAGGNMLGQTPGQYFSKNINKWTNQGGLVHY